MDRQQGCVGYIANDTRAFKTFVVSRVYMIQENSKWKQWKHDVIVSSSPQKVTRYFCNVLATLIARAVEICPIKLKSCK